MSRPRGNSSKISSGRAFHGNHATRAETEHERQAYLDKWRSDHSQQLVQAQRQVSAGGHDRVDALRQVRQQLPEFPDGLGGAWR